MILACRDAAKAKQAAADIRQSTSNGRVTVRIVDLASFASVRKFCKQIVESGQRVDILINNAGNVIFTCRAVFRCDVLISRYAE